MKRAYGGVVIDLSGRVLLRKPADTQRGVAWTFPKGKPKPRETPDETALREVWEETGVRGKILEKIPGHFMGARTRHEFFLMVPLEITGHHDHETLELRWATQEQAAALISLTRRDKRRERDLQVLELAFALYASLFDLERQLSFSKSVPAPVGG